MAPAVTAKVIVLQSHPVWAAAQERQRERRETMSRHPSSYTRRGMPRNIVGQLASRLPNTRSAKTIGSYRSELFTEPWSYIIRHMYGAPKRLSVHGHDRRRAVAERLAGKVALISGGARGMGASHVRSLVGEGAKVVFGDILDDEGKAVAAEVGDAVRYLHLDVTKPEDWDAAVATALGEFGRIDVLVNNAGIINIGTLEDYALSEWQRILDINLTGVFLGIRAVVKPMKEAGRGSIINISSIEGMAGTIACHGYTATKFAVRGLTKSAALELGPSGIRVNSIHPGLIKTPMTDWVPDDIFQSALGRAAQPVEVSNLVVYLASDESSYSTGSEFVVDGGTTAGLGHKDFSNVETDAQPDWVT